MFDNLFIFLTDWGGGLSTYKKVLRAFPGCNQPQSFRRTATTTSEDYHNYPIWKEISPEAYRPPVPW
jgi:hypothetical protein